MPGPGGWACLARPARVRQAHGGADAEVGAGGPVWRDQLASDRPTPAREVGRDLPFRAPSATIGPYGSRGLRRRRRRLSRLRARQPPDGGPIRPRAARRGGGQDRIPNIKIPAAFAKQFHTKLDWDFATEPEPHCDGRSLYIPRGKALGGSSSMNAMLYVRGRPLDYDLWEARGRRGLGLGGRAALLPQGGEQRARRLRAPRVGGPLNVADERSPRPLTERFLDAAERVGIPRISDYNGPEQDGAALAQVTQRNGRRWSTADAYLRPAQDRPNLEVVTRRPRRCASRWTATAPSACASATGAAARRPCAPSARCCSARARSARRSS